MTPKITKCLTDLIKDMLTSTDEVKEAQGHIREDLISDQEAQDFIQSQILLQQTEIQLQQLEIQAAQEAQDEVLAEILLSGLGV